MHHQASFITDFFTKAVPSLKPGEDFAFFMTPDIDTKYAGAVTGSGDLFGMFKDTPQARALMKYLTTAEAQDIWVKKGGKLAVNKQVPLSDYPDALSKASADVVVNTKIGKYDATDQMPADMKAAAWADLVKFIQNQNQLDTLLAHLDSVQAKAYKT